jgi:pyridoxal phosphate enzyme (YggS family)
MSVTSDNLQDVQKRIARAVEAAQRAPGTVALIAVTKTVAAATVVDALAAGQARFGENYLQEGIAKIDEVARQWPAAYEPRPEWHFIGPIQSNKTRAIAERFDWVHSVDRARIAERLSAQRDAARGPLNVLIEVNIDDAPTKSGVAPADVAALARLVTSLPNLALRGLMAVPAYHDDPDAQRAPFARLRGLADQLAAEGIACEHLSMGMSADLESAILEGATMVRVGTAIFGARPRALTEAAA